MAALDNTNFAMDVGRAKKAEEQRQLEDPFGTRDWDEKADARQQAWDSSRFVQAFTTLFAKKPEVGFDNASD